MYSHFLWHTLRLRFDKSHRVPLTMNVHVTNRCCNRCVYCQYDRSSPDLLTLEAFDDIFSQARRLGGRRVNLTGGEALLRQDLADIVRNAKKYGFFVSVATSGAGVEKQLEALRLCDQVMLSFDGPLELREELTGRLAAEGSEASVRLFRENGIPFWTTTVLNRRNVDWIDWIVDHARSNGSQANFVLLETQTGDEVMRFHPNPEEVSDLLLTDEECRRAIGHLIELKKSGAPVGSSMPYLEEWFAWPDYGKLWSERPSKLYKECIALRSMCELSADGRLHSCDAAFAHLPGLSALEMGFAEAFRQLPVETACRSCVSSCYLESNLIFSLNPRTVWNWVCRLK